jgi:hypothetical protein
MDQNRGTLTIIVSVSNTTSSDLVLESGHEMRDWVVSYAIGGRTLDVGGASVAPEGPRDHSAVCPSPEYAIVLHARSSISRIQKLELGEGTEMPMRGTLRVRLAEYPADLRCGPATFITRVLDIAF